jgi:hypothetical protein
MGPKTTAAITGGMGGALVGAITGWLVDGGTGAGLGALVGGTAMALVGVSAAGGMSSSGTGTGKLPRGVGRAAQAPVRRVFAGYGALNSQLAPAAR